MFTSGLFHLRLPWYEARNLDHPCDTSLRIQARRPHFLCFEFDILQANDLAVCSRQGCSTPTYPLLMITVDLHRVQARMPEHQKQDHPLRPEARTAHPRFARRLC
jgi:hypothetical protein